MNKFYLSLIALCFCSFSNAQISQEWEFIGGSVFGHNTVHFRQIGTTILAKAEMFEGGSHEQAQSIEINGTENWYESYTNFNECNNCGLQGIKDIVISSSGDFYSVGEQPASPFTAGYFSKQDIDGNMVFVNEYFEGTIAVEFHFVDLSVDENNVFISGEDAFNDESNEIIYKMNTDGSTVSTVATSLFFPGAFDNNEGQLFIAEFQTEGFVVESFNEDLSYNWTNSMSFENATFYGLHSAKLPNQSMLYIGVVQDFNSSITKLMFFEVDSQGNSTVTYHDTPYDSSFFLQLEDVDRSDDGVVGLVYVARGGFEVNEPQGAQGGKGGPTYNYMHCLTYNSLYNENWDTFIPAYNGDQTNNFQLPKLELDENNNVILTYSENYYTDETGNTTRLKVLLFNNLGNIEDEYNAASNFTFAPEGLFYAGNQTFYIQSDALNQDQNNSWAMIKFSYLLSSVSELDKQQIETFPNPFSEQLKINNPIQNSTISIFNLEGKIVFEKSQMPKGFTTLDLEALSSGVYFLRINGVPEPQKIIKL